MTQFSPRSHPRHLVGKRTAQKDAIEDITSDSQVNSYFPYRWSPAILTFKGVVGWCDGAGPKLPVPGRPAFLD